MNNLLNYFITGGISFTVALAVTGLFAPWMNNKLAEKRNKKEKFDNKIDKVTDVVQAIETIRGQLNLRIREACIRQNFDTREMIIDRQFVTEQSESVFLLRKYLFTLNYLRIRNQKHFEKPIWDQSISYQKVADNSVNSLDESINELKTNDKQTVSRTNWEFDGDMGLDLIESLEKVRSQI
ncbi:hypothetical protein HC026_00980 [Lactobacillus sp. LC28-10]|uniref:Uncharacterized protein n=1 Tax=Secundilactobacillus angelensis TaxID=2722706 RepID=A0ABX1KW63_9LACO|nr:hypothetical protein [Secundilactobacillus angelensis]MCH5461319.1 hypothetical protein [Secundilactobacillus angelensis]NLR17485.1 hypothetical protein [Secundilactobacillus angelensis]